MGVFKGEKFKDTISDDEVVAYDVPTRYLFLFFSFSFVHRTSANPAHMLEYRIDRHIDTNGQTKRETDWRSVDFFVGRHLLYLRREIRRQECVEKENKQNGREKKKELLGEVVET